MQPASILVVEDEAIVAMDIAYQLREMGYEVCATADNGEDAIAYIEKYHPDLVLMDIVIKGSMDGIETAKCIAHRFHLPVIFLTAYSDAQTVDRAAKTAPYGYLTKPFQANELRAGIEVALYKTSLEKRLRESENWFSSTLRCVADAVIATDIYGQIQFINPAAEAILGWQFEEVKGDKVEDVLKLRSARTGAPLDCPVLGALRDDVVVGIDFGTLITTKSGQELPIDDSAAPIRSDDGSVIGAVMVFREVSDRLEVEKALQHSEERFRKAFDFAPVGMALIGLDSTILQVNTAFCRLLGSTDTNLLGMYQSELTHPADIENEKIRLYELILGQTTTVQFEKRYRSQLGNDIWTLVNVSLLMQQDEPLCYLYQIHDLTERKETEYQLSLLAHYDPLTGLANRLRLWEEADSQILAAKRQREGLAVLFIDLDNFKQINDSMGHEAGDLLLQEVALRLRSAVRESDCVARLGGDEFVLLLPNVQTAEDVSAITNKIWAEFAKPVMIENHAIMVGLSMGVSLYPDDGQDAKTLLRCADSALYHAKSEGRNNMQFYRLELTARLGHKLKMERGLRIAIEEKQFEIYYQPIITMSGGGIHSAEALIRWHHPDLGLVMPDTFIQLTEETGLISPIGEWVMHEACRQAVTWQRDGHEGIGISVNVSARQFKSNEILQNVEDALADSGLSPALLTLEVTEQLMLQNTEQNLSLIANLKDLGVRIAIDDFGVGYSSLNYIKRFNPHKLKIDRSFVHDLVGNPEDEAIVRAIVAMAHSLKMLVVAEGIETEVQRNFLQQEGCDLAQGFFYAKPCSAEDFRAWIADHPDSPGYYPGN